MRRAGRCLTLQQIHFCPRRALPTARERLHRPSCQIEKGPAGPLTRPGRRLGRLAETVAAATERGALASEVVSAPPPPAALPRLRARPFSPALFKTLLPCCSRPPPSPTRPPWERRPVSSAPGPAATGRSPSCGASRCTTGPRPTCGGRGGSAGMVANCARAPSAAPALRRGGTTSGVPPGRSPRARRPNACGMR